MQDTQGREVRIETIEFWAFPSWNKAGRLIVNKGLETELHANDLFSKDHANAVIKGAFENGTISQEQADELSRQVAESALPQSLGGKIVLVECGHCKGHGWLVTADYRIVDVETKADARDLVTHRPENMVLTDEDISKVLAQINASALP